MLLYINASPSSDIYSTTGRIANEFLDEFKEHNNEVIKRVDLFDYDLPDIDRDIMSRDESALTQEKKHKREEALKDFMNASKVVIAAPMWNFLYPAVLKTWLDAIVVSKKTFEFTPDGPIGLIKDKKILFIQSSGSDYSKTPEMNYALNHLRAVMEFMGITEMDAILAYGTAKNRAAIELEKIQEAVELAKRF